MGQDTLVRSLTHAFQSGRLAQAYLLTGIRGTGKTTTARIIAKCLNCVGADGQGAVTADPCGVCANCTAIAEDRHIDVIEMDAATRTGIDDIREIVDAIRYAPATARYKVFIVDEVHMLSDKAFNGLLKTLEEPPPHGKFVFATTEARKLPVTVLSRCQRFDLRRIDSEALGAHLRRVAEEEGTTVDDNALPLLLNAAGGSARDALSLLDQAITLSDGAVNEATVADMLGLADQGQIRQLLTHLADGEAAAALELYADLIDRGADPVALIEDLLSLCHALTRRQMLSAGAGDPLAALAQRLSLGSLGRAWQVLLHGLDEVARAPDAIVAAEMLLVRLACMGQLPSPEELARQLTGGGDKPQSLRRPGAGPPSSGPTSTGSLSTSAAASGPTNTAPPPSERPTVRPQAAVAEAPAPLPPMPATPQELHALLGGDDERILAASLYKSARIESFEPGRLGLSWEPGTPHDMNTRLQKALHRLTGRRWVVEQKPSTVPTLAEIETERRQHRLKAVAELPHVRHILEQVPGSAVIDVEDDATIEPPISHTGGTGRP